MDHPFERFTTWCARLAGRPAMLFVCMMVAALAIVAFAQGSDRLMWGASLATSVVTVILLPILQETQNRDSAALHAKIDELIKTNAEARNALIGLENRPVEEIEQMRADEEDSAPDPGSPPFVHR
jgi:low affinity Fe/Cu permease